MGQDERRVIFANPLPRATTSEPVQTPVFLTIDTELLWRHHAAGLPAAEVVRRSLEPGDVGIGYQLRMLAEHGLKACFFVDPMPAMVYGLDSIRRVVGNILDAGQEVQLHLHAVWCGASAEDRSRYLPRYEMCERSADEQRGLIVGARDLLLAAGAPNPIAFRAGSYAGDDTMCRVLADLGFAYDSSYNASIDRFAAAMSVGSDRMAPVAHEGLIEVPVTLITDASGAPRHFQLCALSTAEMRAALDHALVHDHAAVTIVGHGFELASRAGTKANPLHVRRFAALCRMLAERGAAMPTSHFADHPELRLGQDDRPLASGTLRTRWRQAEQAISNVLLDRAA